VAAEFESVPGESSVPSKPAQRRTIAIHCAACRRLLYRYKKGGSGGLVKCFVERIVEDRTAGDLCCSHCGQLFARLVRMSGKTAHKIIQGKVFTRGMRRK
jgi:hypothetical protein